MTGLDMFVLKITKEYKAAKRAGRALNWRESAAQFIENADDDLNAAAVAAESALAISPQDDVLMETVRLLHRLVERQAYAREVAAAGVTQIAMPDSAGASAAAKLE